MSGPAFALTLTAAAAALRDGNSAVKLGRALAGHIEGTGAMVRLGRILKGAGGFAPKKTVPTEAACMRPGTTRNAPGLDIAAAAGREDPLLAVARWCARRLPFEGLA